MPVKITCKVCGKYIKDVEPKFFNELTGHEICKSCGKKMEAGLIDIKNLKVQMQIEVDKLYNEFMETVGDIERQKKRVVHRLNLVLDEKVAEFEILKKHILEGTPKEKKNGSKSRNVGGKTKNPQNKKQSDNATVSAPK